MDQNQGNSLGQDDLQDQKRAQYAKFAWFFLIYTVAAILWGAFVRVSFSGDGCGAHWPTCGGELIPTDPTAKTITEFIHRLSTGLVGLLAFPLLIGAYRVFSKKSLGRKAAWVAFIFVFLEAFIGAVLVRKGWVAYDDSTGRVVTMVIHLVNTFILLGFATLTALLASKEFSEFEKRNLVFKGQSAVGWLLGAGILGIFLLGVSGAVTALGDTLYPVKDGLNAFKESLTPGVHFLVKLRILHPMIAIGVGLYLFLMGSLICHLRPDEQVRKSVKLMVYIYFAQMGLGFLNVGLGAPAWLQIVHLAFADIMLINIVFVAAATLREGVERRELVVLAPTEETFTFGQMVKQYVALTKPRVISLLLFTTLTALYAAQQSVDGRCPPTLLTLVVAIGGYMAAGAANAINMVIDRDIDGTMKRTAKRPTVTQSISSRNALFFALTLAVGSFGILWAGANLLAAILSLAGLVFYVCIYTLMLKRTTTQNIVIGGAAGAFPPLVGWAAVTGNLSPLALWLFAIIFMWTPVHFWALAIMIKDDYAAAGVPMMPVVKGEKATVVQMIVYAFLTAGVSLMPMATREVGTLYVVSAIILNAILIIRTIKFSAKIDRPHALGLYKFSMLYLALLFLVLPFDQSIRYGQLGPKVSEQKNARYSEKEGLGLEKLPGIGVNQALGLERLALGEVFPNAHHLTPHAFSGLKDGAHAAL